jgi:arylsulfatase A-like enzyme
VPNGYFVWWGGKNDLVPGQDGYQAYCDVKFRPHQEDFERWGLTARKDSHDDLLPWRGKPGDDTYYGFLRGKLDKGAERVFGDLDWAYVFGAIEFIRDYKGERPLFIYLPLQYPHPPYAVEEPWFGMIDRKAVPPRTPPPENWRGKPSILKGIHERQGLQGWTEDRWTELRATYYGTCARVDHQFGLVIQALREAGLYDDTAVFFFSDHGDYTGDYGIVEKTQNTFEDCLSRVPFVIKPPRGAAVQPGIHDALVELLDFPATVFELTGLQPGYAHFGKSLLPLIANRTAEHRDAVFCEGGRLYGEEHCMEKDSSSSDNPEGLYWPRVGLQRTDDGPYHTKAAMCRTRDFKYVRRLYESDELYNLQKDPQESHNVIGDPAYASQLAELKERLLRWYMETCDVVPQALDKRGW